MSCFRLPKKLLPSKKACKSFISTLTIHLRHVIPKTHRRRRCHYRRHQNTAVSSPSLHHHRRQSHQYATTIYVDRLFPADAPARPAPKTPAVAVLEAASSGGGGRKWKEYLESVPKIRGVDERAEEFITNFRQQMKIEREQSLLDFQEMLARSS